MNFYFAPLEGITGYIYRNAHHKYFPHIDKYFTPFIAPNQNRCMNRHEMNDILPEHNEGLFVVPQILTNCSSDFINTAKELKSYGYTEINLNLGCPSPTVVTKHKGSGFLEFPDRLDIFFDEIFSALDLKISVKTRIGKISSDEFETLLHIYNRYPISELIVHPRIQQDIYKNTPNIPVFAYGMEKSTHPLCYNGDITDEASYQKITSEFGELKQMMLGRGLVAEPWLAENLQGYDVNHQSFKKFHDEIYYGYKELLSGDKNVLYRMKELWFYMIKLFPDSEKIAKKIRKSQCCADYEAAIKPLF